MAPVASVVNTSGDSSCCGQVASCDLFGDIAPLEESARNLDENRSCDYESGDSRRRSQTTPKGQPSVKRGRSGTDARCFKVMQHLVG